MTKEEIVNELLMIGQRFLEISERIKEEEDYLDGLCDFLMSGANLMAAFSLRLEVENQTNSFPNPPSATIN